MISSNLFRWMRAAPVTTGCVAVCLALFLATTKPRQTEVQRLDALHQWGAVLQRTVINPVDHKPLELHGPLALWQGQLWRIPVCAFHHVDFWHLGLNCLAALYLGRLLEPRWGVWRMLLFVAMASFVPLVPEFLIGNYVLGFSGVVAGMFGALCVLRYRDQTLAEEFPDEAVHLGGAMLAFGVVSTIIGLIPVANLAHMTGFFYGALAGCVTTGLPWGVVPARLLRFAVILLSVGALWWIAHPTWDGNYHWYLALRTDDREQRYAELQQTVKLEPRAIGAWRQLEWEELRRGETMRAWKTILAGLSHNPADLELLTRARLAWRHLVITPRRTEAEQAIREIFGDRAEAWTAQFRAERLDQESLPMPFPSPVADVDPVLRFPLNRSVDLALPELPRSEQTDDPLRTPPEGDAVEGRAM